MGEKCVCQLCVMDPIKKAKCWPGQCAQWLSVDTCTRRSLVQFLPNQGMGPGCRLGVPRLWAGCTQCGEVLGGSGD